MLNAHGEYYLKVGKGKYLQRFCRICGDDRSFGSEQDLDHHIISHHPLHHFAPTDTDSDAGSDIIEIVQIKKEPAEKRAIPKKKTNDNPPKQTSRNFPTTNRVKYDPPKLQEYNPTPPSPVPMFGEPIPQAQETNRVKYDPPKLQEYNPLVFEEQKKRI